MLDDSYYTARELERLNEWFQLHDDLLPEPFTFTSQLRATLPSLSTSSWNP